MTDGKPRCPWAGPAGPMRDYHDAEWGVPVTDDKRLFEFLVLESAQSGLSWKCILGKREGYRAAFAGFDPTKVALFTPEDIEVILADPRVVRNRRKVESAVANAQAFLETASRFGSFAAWYWGHTDGRPVENAWREMSDVPASTAASAAMAREMKALGFRFMGPVVVYSFMQATGMVNDHLTGCFRHEEVRALGEAM